MAEAARPNGSQHSELRDVQRVHREGIKEVQRIQEYQRKKDLDQELRIAVLGRTGVGKSSVCNHLSLQPQREGQPALFPVEEGPTSTSLVCQQKSFTSVNNQLVSVVDTPGFYSTDLDPKESISEIIRCQFLVSPGPHVFLFVLRADQKLTREVLHAFRDCQEIFEGMSNYTIFVLTGKDILVKADILRKSVESVKQMLGSIFKECGNRFITFDNSLPPESQENVLQVEELFKMIKDMTKLYKVKFYSNQTLANVERLIKRQGRDAVERKIGEPTLGEIEAKYKKKLEKAEGIEKLHLKRKMIEEVQDVLDHTKRSYHRDIKDIRSEIQKKPGWRFKAWLNYKLYDIGMRFSDRGISGLRQAMTELAEIDPNQEEELNPNPNPHLPIQEEEPVASVTRVTSND